MESDKKEEKKVSKKNLYTEKCYHCKNDNNEPFEIEIKKNKETTKEMKELLKESIEKYGNRETIKRAILNGCPKCHRTILLHPAHYLDFYYPSDK